MCGDQQYLAAVQGNSHCFSSASNTSLSAPFSYTLTLKCAKMNTQYLSQGKGLGTGIFDHISHNPYICISLLYFRLLSVQRPSCVPYL